MTCNVRQNTITHMQEKGYIDENFIIKNPMFFYENNKLSDLARDKYNVKNSGKLFVYSDVSDKKTKAVPNEEFFTELQEKHNLLNNIPDNQVLYNLKAIEILSSIKAEEIFQKGKKNKWSLDKVLTELQTPKEQRELILQLGKINREEIITDLLTNYSYTVEINTAKEKISFGDSLSEPFTIGSDYYNILWGEDNYGNPTAKYLKNGISITEDQYDEAYVKEFGSSPTNYYSNLTVPGGTNYTENEIVTPAITPSIKGHAQFSTDNGIGWFRSDDKSQGSTLTEAFTGDFAEDNLELEYDNLVEQGLDISFNEFKKEYIKQNSGIPTKTRRILEVQSDLFQKGRDNKELVKRKADYNLLTEEEEKERDELIRKFNQPESEEDVATFSQKRLDELNEKLTANKNQIYGSENQFLQLLNKNNNWVTFFVKSIIQDSANKGYEKVLFPTGNTASKIEGHDTLEQFKKQKEDRIKELEERLLELESDNFSNLNVFNFAEVNLEEAKKIITNSFINATQEEAKLIYRKFAIQYHPDKGGSEELMKHLNDVNDKFKNGKLDKEKQDINKEVVKKFYEEVKNNLEKHREGETILGKTYNSNTFKYKNDIKLTSQDFVGGILSNKGYFKVGNFIRYALQNPNLFEEDSLEILKNLTKGQYYNSANNLANTSIRAGNPSEFSSINSLGAVFVNKSSTKGYADISEIHINPAYFDIKFFENNFNNDKFKEFVNTIGHELVHKLTIPDLLSDNTTRKEIEEIYKAAKEAYKDYTGIKNNITDYALSNLSEFTANYFNSKEFKDFLKTVNVKSENNKNKSLLDKLISIIARFFNKNYGITEKNAYEYLTKIINNNTFYGVPNKVFVKKADYSTVNENIQEEKSRIENEINQLKQELERVEREGFAALKPIFKFYEETVFNILKKQGYNPENITDEYGNGWFEIIPKNEKVLLQKQGTESSKASDKTLQKVKDFLEQIGVNTKKYTGNRKDINALANRLQSIVEIVEGKENVALTEEAMHFATFIIQESHPELYRRMLNRINKYQIYEEILKQYRTDPEYQFKDGSPNIPKIKFEAIGKLLAEYFIKTEEGITEKPELLEQRKSWIQEIIDWFKTKILKHGNPFEGAIKILPKLETSTKTKELAELIQLAIPETNYLYSGIQILMDQKRYSEIVANIGEQLLDPATFQATIDTILEGNVDLGKEILEYYQNSTLFQKSNESLIRQLDKTASEVINKPLDDGDNAYFIGDIQVKNRVTRWVKTIMGDRFRNRKLTPWQKQMEDQFREWGSRGHRDMQKLFKRYLTPEGKIEVANNQLVIQSNETISSEIDPNNLGIFNTLHDYVRELLMSYPEGTVFRIEQTIYSPKGGKTGERDIAGTMDFMAILPDGKKDILDWKFAKVNSDQYKDIAWFKQNEWQLQMLEYKKILKNQYGLKDKDFGKTRMIPFILTYTNTGSTREKAVFTPIDVETAGVNIKIDEKTYLLPVVTPDEATGNKKVDQLISSLTSLYNTLKDLPESEGRKDIRSEQLQKLFAAIRHLQVSGNLRPLTEEMAVLVKETERLIKNHNTKFSDINSVSEQQISDEASELLIKAQALQTLQNVHLTLVDFYGDSPTKQESEILEDLRQMSLSVNDTLTKVKDTIESFTDKYIATRRGIEGILDAEKTVTGLTRLFNTTSQLPTAALKTLFSMIDYANNQIQFELADIKDELVEIKKETDKSIGIRRLIELVKKKDANELIDQYDSRFFKELEKAIESGNTEWILENLDIEALKEYFKKQRAEQTAIINDTIYVADEEENDSIRKQKIQDLINRTDINNRLALIDQNQYYHLKKFPKNDWFSDEYKALKTEPVALKFYEFVRKINTKAREIGYLQGANVERKFLPYLYRSFAEKMALGGKYSFSDFLISNLTIDENIAGYGNFDPLTGQARNSVPTYFTQKVDNPSEDLFLNMAAYARAVVNYEHKIQIDGQVRALHFVENNKGSLEVNKFGNLTRINGQPVEIKSNERNAKLLLAHIESLQYGQKYAGSVDTLLGDWVKGYNSFADKANKVMGVKAMPKFSKDQEGKQVSLSRLMDTLNRFFIVKNMGLNIATSASVLMGGNFQAIINSGKYYTKSQFLASEFSHAVHSVIKDTETHLALMRAFMPVDEELNREINKLTAGKITANAFSDLMMVLMRKADHTVQYTNFLAFMKNTIIKDGKIYNARQYYLNSPEYANRYNLSETERLKMESEFETEVQKLINDYGIEKTIDIDDKGKLNLDMKSENISKYRTLISTIGRKAVGNISPENEMMIRMNAVTRSMMVFKNWIPGLMKQRFGGLNKDEATEDWEYGRVRILLKHMGPLALLKFKNINDILKGTDRGIHLLKEYYQRQKADYEEVTNKELDLTEAQFMDLFRQALGNQIKEVVILMNLIGIILVLPAFKPDDDDDQEVKNKFKFASRMLDKIKDEVSFYYDPRGMQQILNGSIFPSLGIFTDAANVTTSILKELYGITTGDEELTDKTYPIKQVMKSLPITREMVYYIAMFNSDLAKELGIQISSQSRMR